MLNVVKVKTDSISVLFMSRTVYNIPPMCVVCIHFLCFLFLEVRDGCKIDRVTHKFKRFLPIVSKLKKIIHLILKKKLLPFILNPLPFNFDFTNSYFHFV